MPAAPVIRICIAFVPLRLRFTRSEAAPYEFEVIARDGSLQTIEGVRVFRGGDEALGVERRQPARHRAVPLPAAPLAQEGGELD